MNNANIFMFKALIALAKRNLKDVNDSLENPDDWPAGQTWETQVNNLLWY